VITNARQHLERHGRGGWHVADRVMKCDRYFGRVRLCPGAMRPGERYFDTGERADARALRTPTFKVCHACGHALAEPHLVKKSRAA
jgi:hypothetical protein